MDKILSFIITAFACASAQADELRVVTSFPSEMTQVFEDLWTDRYPDVELQVLNKNTVSAVEEIQRENLRRFDLFWASSPEAFVFLHRSERFAAQSACGGTDRQSVEKFAISSVGWARRRDSTLFFPGEWNDLLLPIYKDQIAMARPARSGTTHLLVEQLLQMRGWDDGWAYLLELSGNLSTLTARSYGVPDGLINQRFEIGLTIDFLATSRADQLQFQYGRPLMPFSAQIGILDGGENPEMACAFVDLLLSQEGQMALTDPRVSRIPIDPDIRSEIGDAISPEITAGLALPWLIYDAETSADRYWAVNALFDLMISDVLQRRRALWHRFKQHSFAGAAEHIRQCSGFPSTSHSPELILPDFKPRFRYP